MFGSGFAPVFFGLIYLCIIVAVVWLVVSSLLRIARGVEDIAQTLRRMEEKNNRTDS